MEQFYNGKKVFVTGHTGFKGAWLCRVLAKMGAVVTGYALPPPTSPSLFEEAGCAGYVHSVIGDIRNFAALQAAFDEARPEIVLHLAAQPLVRESYQNPRETYEINVMGTVNIQECVRQSDTVRSYVNVTTDKVYRNNEWIWGYRENDALDGFDPYSNSKSCSELVTAAYNRSFNANMDVSISTARAGNVIGGGDFAADRIVPDCMRAIVANEKIRIRNPGSTRPYQHVLEPVYAYLLIAMRAAQDSALAGSYNVGPDNSDCVTTGNLVQLFCDTWGEDAAWYADVDASAPHEANFLKLDHSLISTKLGWQPQWDINRAIGAAIEWYKAYQQKQNVVAVMDEQIECYRSQCQWIK